ncbi:hypothetical protein, partial [Nocardia alni]|uniref:hypothetical protein n=1 Tax=Nocardia alni TaxID=2815723 RepID=UPI001C2250C3
PTTGHPPPPPVFGAPVPGPGGAPIPQPGYGQRPGYPPPQGWAPSTGAPQPGMAHPGGPPVGVTQPGMPPSGMQQGMPQQGYPGNQPYPGTQPAGPPGMPPGAPPGATQAPGAPPQGFPTPAPAGLSVGRALGYGWDHFRTNPIPWVSITLVGFVAYLAVTFLVRVAGLNSVLPLILIFLVVSVVVWLLQAAMIRGALYESDGTPPDFQAFFGFVNAGNVLLVALGMFAGTVLAMVVVSAIVAIVSKTLATILGLVAAIAVGFLCMFALHFVIDQDLKPIAALRSSVQLVIANVGQMLLLALAILVVTAIAILLCGVGLLVAGPVCVMALTYSYRTLIDGLTL